MDKPPSVLQMLRVIIDQAIRSARARLQPAPVVYFSGAVVPKPFPEPMRIIVMDFNVNLDQKINARVVAKDRAGNEVAIQNPTWAASDETVIQVTASEDGMSAVIDTIGVGAARVVLSGDADLGDGVVPITAEANVTVAAGSARTLELQGDVVAKEG